MYQPHPYRATCCQQLACRHRTRFVRCLLALVVCVGLMDASRPAWSQEESVPVQSEAGDSSAGQSIEYWISQLGHEHYLRREMASKKLVAAGADAVDQLANAIRSGDLEVVERATAALVEIASASAPLNDGGAYQRLNAISVETVGRAASVARGAMRAVRLHRHVQAREALAGAGISVGIREFAIGAIAQQRMLVQIDENWNGDTEPLQWLAWLDQVEYARVIGPAVTPEVLRNVTQVPGLRSVAIVDATIEDAVLEPLTKLDRIDTLDIRYVRLTEKQGDMIASIPLRVSLNLMGTGIAPEKVDAMRAALPGLQIDFRRGGFLGVMCIDNFNACEISGIESNSAAEEAGLIKGDIIVQIDEAKVEHFRDLQAAINEHVPGDYVDVQFRRGDRIESVKLRLRRFVEK